mgnify:CR=1 FL=1|jgi:SAM-dependent methyltransferase|tara:strand:+ start:531 stop:1298 length:768 start_codon:yes stop_codon:yes gene_type:complete
MKIIKKSIFYFLEKITTKKQYQKILYLYSKHKQNKMFKNMSVEQRFSKVYNEHLWKDKNHQDKNFKFFSGSGSHEAKIINPYIRVVSEFLKTLNKPVVVDAGCGDFNVGINFIDLVSKYYAFDIFEDLIKLNKENFKFQNLIFEKKDIIKDFLPSADILFVRQVLQHLDNESIKKFMRNVENKYNFLIITEHMPDQTFTPNLDKISGGFMGNFSGVILDKNPFNINYITKKELLEVPAGQKKSDGVIKTFLYQLK